MRGLPGLRSAGTPPGIADDRLGGRRVGGGPGWVGQCGAGAPAAARILQSGISTAQRVQVSAIRHSLPARSVWTLSTTGPPHWSGSADGADTVWAAPWARAVGSGVCQAQLAARQAHHASLFGPPQSRIRPRFSLARWSGLEREQVRLTWPAEGARRGPGGSSYTCPATRSACCTIGGPSPHSLIVPSRIPIISPPIAAAAKRRIGRVRVSLGEAAGSDNGRSRWRVRCGRGCCLSGW